MAARLIAETRAQADDWRAPRKWMSAWRLAGLATAVAGVTVGLGLAGNWLTGGQVIILLVIAGPCALACLFWSRFSDGGRDRFAAEPIGSSDWEMRIRPQFPRDERSEIDVKRQNEGDEA